MDMALFQSNLEEVHQKLRVYQTSVFGKPFDMFCLFHGKPAPDGHNGHRVDITIVKRGVPTRLTSVNRKKVITLQEYWRKRNADSPADRF